MTRYELCMLSAHELAALVLAGGVTPVEVTEAVLRRIEKLNPVLFGSFTTRLADLIESTVERRSRN